LNSAAIQMGRFVYRKEMTYLVDTLGISAAASPLLVIFAAISCGLYVLCSGSSSARCVLVDAG
jgi:hypothetical protein